ncbi:amino acid permease [Myxococcota bacterium]|nr:amino acid permease [Myxococcota bacterium]MBU1380148.1 amino acid permease [Myxococcota bacterium]MBU1495645.1 amino acid permease [Myxococcota bacterium]
MQSTDVIATNSTINANTDSHDKWQQTIGLGGALAIVIGSILGIGVFLTPQIVAQHVPNTKWFLGIWAVGGLMALAGAFVYAELGSMFPHAGGDYVFMKEAYGKPVAFLSGWICLAATFSGSIAATAVALAQYYIGPNVAFMFNQYLGMDIGNSFYTPFFTLGMIKISWMNVVAISFIVIFTMINVLGINFSTIVQGFIAFTPLVVLIFAAIYAFAINNGYSMAASMNATTPAGSSSSGSVSILPLGLALLPVFFAYSGWSSAAYIGSEIKDAKRNLPISLISGIGIIIFLYMLLNLLFIKGETMASLRAMPNFLDAAALKSFGPIGIPVFLTLVAIAIMATINSTILTGPRIYHSMAKDGMLFKSMGKLSPKYRTPAYGLMLQGAIAIAYVLLGGFETILNYTTMMIVIFSSITVIGLIILRRRKPAQAGEFRSPLYPLFPAIYLGMSAFLMISIGILKPLMVVRAGVIIAVGLAIYYVFAHKKVARSANT